MSENESSATTETSSTTGGKNPRPPKQRINLTEHISTEKTEILNSDLFKLLGNDGNGMKISFLLLFLLFLLLFNVIKIYLFY